MSERLREIEEYLDRFATKHHITREEALNYVMVKLFEEYKKDQDKKEEDDGNI
ncbi:hypothetical protein SAMN02910413_1669 [Pseudobutyrivibrio sp. C4]|uniref:hypothetical protein n=1 Tax=Pseudobutyrivibrio sp. C4 TaxID=1520803 RepID=UPI0008AE0E3F|nr:hypothetical protein [Pseudobutyrivibrio sp. C4]SET05560.1 hypothetical protein SAMN02910413_1669 [Pseudobutyrivibrio sp. C4]